MFELPAELEKLTYKNQSIIFSYGFGEIFKTDKYTKTLIKGSGGGGTINSSFGNTYGNFNSIYIKSDSIVVSDIWLKSDDGRDINCQLFNSNIGFLEGHRVMYLLGKGKSTEPPITMTLYNLALRDGYSNNVGKANFILLNNPKGFLKNPHKRQFEFEEFVHKHVLKIHNHISSKH